MAMTTVGGVVTAVVGLVLCVVWGQRLGEVVWAWVLVGVWMDVFMSMSCFYLIYLVIWMGFWMRYW